MRTITRALATACTAFICATFLVLSSHSAWGQTDSLALSSGTAAADGSISLNLTLTSPAGSTPAAIQWTLTYTPGAITSITATAGSAATAAGKTLDCRSTSGSYTCLASGMNTNAIANGTVAVVNAVIAGGVSSAIVGVTNTVAASAAGSAVALTGSAGTITGSSPPPTPVLTSLSCNPTTIVTPSSTTCTATLSGPALTGGALVTLSDNSANLTVPGSITIPAGSASMNFYATATAVSGTQSATVSASYGGVTKTATLSLTSSAPPVSLSSVSCDPTTIVTPNSTTCTAALTGPAPSGGAVISLSDDSSKLSVPSSVTIPASTSSINFSATATAVSGTQSATITASYSGTSRTATLSLTPSAPAVSLTSLSCNPTTIVTPSSTTCTATLSGQAPSGGILVALSDNSASLTIPSSVTVPSGSSSINFYATGATVSTTQNATITASYNGVSRTATLSLTASTPPPTLDEMTCSSSTIVTPNSVTCTVSLSGAAQSGGAMISLSDNSANLTVPGSMMIPSGSTSTTFSAVATTVTATQIARITASYAGVSRMASLTLDAPPTSGGSYSIWSSTDAPANATDADTHATEVGLKFQASAAGYITGVRFYKGSQNTGTHVGHLWSSSGTLLGSVTFSNESSTGWQQANFASPIAIAANTTYVVSYNAPSGHYADDTGYFSSAATTNGVLTALRDGTSGANGLYTYASGVVPNNGFQGSNYWVDVVYSPTVVSGQPPKVTGVANTASFSSSLSPGVLASIFGSGLGTPGTTVSIGGQSAPVLFNNDTQINVQVPTGLSAGSATVLVSANGLTSTGFLISLAPFAPGIFTQDSSGAGLAIVTDAKGNTITAANSAKPGDTVTLYATGLGPTNPSVAVGTKTPNGSYPTTTTPSVRVGGQSATVVSSVLGPGLIGTYEVSFIVPSKLGASTYPMTLSVGAYTSNSVSLPVSGSGASVLGDYNSDGHQDLLWMNIANSQVGVHYYGGTQGTTVLTTAYLDTDTHVGWTVVAAADFDGNGVPDVVWQNNTTREVWVHYYGGSNGRTDLGSLEIYGGALGWTVVAAADFDGNGVPDLVWQNDTTRQLVVHYYGGTRGATWLGWDWLANPGYPGWTVVGAADFDGNGVPDLVFQNEATTQVVVHFYGGTKGTTMLGWGWLANPGYPDWKVVGTADFDGNGVPDLVWQNETTTQVVVHFYGGTNGTTWLGWDWLANPGYPGWTVIVPH